MYIFFLQLTVPKELRIGQWFLNFCSAYGYHFTDSNLHNETNVKKAYEMILQYVDLD